MFLRSGLVVPIIRWISKGAAELPEDEDGWVIEVWKSSFEDSDGDVRIGAETGGES